LNDTACIAADGTRLHYVIDDYTDRWTQAPTVLFLHGLGECTEAWRGWVPYFARHFRVVRMDLRGFGRSTPMPRDHVWSIDELMADVDSMITHIGAERVHLVGGKSGGTMAMYYAATRPAKVERLAVACAPIVGPRGKSWLGHIEEHGVPSWARVTMPGRFGTALGPQALEWWIEMMSRTPITTLQGYLRWVPGVDITAEVPKIRCPTLVITSRDGPLHDVSEVAGWQRTIPRSELMVVAGDCWHAGGAFPDVCAPATAEFFLRKLP